MVRIGLSFVRVAPNMEEEGPWHLLKEICHVLRPHRWFWYFPNVIIPQK